MQKNKGFKNKTISSKRDGPKCSSNYMRKYKTQVQRGTKKKRKMQQVMEANFYEPPPAALW